MPKIVQMDNPHNVGISLWKKSWLDEITNLSGNPDGEYQVHMWSLVLRTIYKDGSIKDIAIPLVIYNYKQEVSVVSVTIDGEDIQTTSEAVKDLAIMKANELMAKLENTGYILDGVTDVLVTPYISLHRHP